MDDAVIAAHIVVSIDDFLNRRGAVPFVRYQYIRKFVVYHSAIFTAQPPDNKYLSYTIVIDVLAVTRSYHNKSVAAYRTHMGLIAEYICLARFILSPPVARYHYH